LRTTALTIPSGLPWRKKREMQEHKIPSSFLLAEALAQQRNKMLDNFTQILQRLPTITGACLHQVVALEKLPHSRYKLILIFPYLKVRSMQDALEKWLNFLEGYFSVHNFFDRENITFALLKDLPHVKHWWETY
jgi:hypothetical protein